MKIRFIIYFVVLLAGVGLYLYYSPTRPRWSPWYCNQFSGVYPIGGGGGTQQCVQAGCRVTSEKLIDDPNQFDDERVVFTCGR